MGQNNSQNGKGDRNRTSDTKKYSKNFDSIKWPSKDNSKISVDKKKTK